MRRCVSVKLTVFLFGKSVHGIDTRVKMIGKNCNYMPVLHQYQIVNQFDALKGKRLHFQLILRYIDIIILLTNIKILDRFIR